MYLPVLNDLGSWRRKIRMNVQRCHHLLQVVLRESLDCLSICGPSREIGLHRRDRVSLFIRESTPCLMALPLREPQTVIPGPQTYSSVQWERVILYCNSDITVYILTSSLWYTVTYWIDYCFTIWCSQQPVKTLSENIIWELEKTGFLKIYSLFLGSRSGIVPGFR